MRAERRVMQAMMFPIGLFGQKANLLMQARGRPVKPTKCEALNYFYEQRLFRALRVLGATLCASYHLSRSLLLIRGIIPAAHLRTGTAAADDFKVAILGAGMDQTNFRLLVRLARDVIVRGGRTGADIAEVAEKLRRLRGFDQANRLLAGLLFKEGRVDAGVGFHGTSFWVSLVAESDLSRATMVMRRFSSASGFVFSSGMRSA